MKKEIQNLESFDTINFKDFGTLILRQGEKESLTIEASEDVLEALIAEVNQGALTIGLEGDWLSNLGKAISSLLSNEQRKVTYTLTVVDLKKINISGQCNLRCDGLAVDELKINISGLGHANFAQLDCNSLKINISGRGEFEAAGRADDQIIKISGSGDYNTPQLASQVTQIKISGQGNATVRTAESLNIMISGMGQVNYYGQPKLRQVVSGLGKAKRLSDEKT